MSQLSGDKIDEVHKNMCPELQGPQKTIIFNTFPTSYLFHTNFVPFALQSLYNKYEHFLCMISSHNLFA